MCVSDEGCRWDKVGGWVQVLGAWSTPWRCSPQSVPSTSMASLRWGKQANNIFIVSIEFLIITGSGGLQSLLAPFKGVQYYRYLRPPRDLPPPQPLKHPSPEAWTRCQLLDPDKTHIGVQILFLICPLFHFYLVWNFFFVNYDVSLWFLVCVVWMFYIHPRWRFSVLSYKPFVHSRFCLGWP